MLPRIPLLARVMISFGLVWGVPNLAGAQLKQPESSVPRDIGHRPGEGDLAAKARALNERANSPTARLPDSAWRGDYAKVAALLKRGADPNDVRQASLTPLQQAAKRGHLKVMRLLIDHGADIHASDNRKGNVVTQAAGSGEGKALQMLLEAGAKPDATALAAASRYGRFENVRLLLEAGINPDAGMLEAAGGGHVEVLRLLLEKGANANAKESRFSNTPLHEAATHGGMAALQILLDNGADPNAQNAQGQTPLHRAVSVSPPPVVTEQEVLDRIRLLVTFGAKLDIADQEGVTPVRLAAIQGRKPLYDWLVAANGGHEPQARKPETQAAPEAAQSTKELLAVLSSRDHKRWQPARRELAVRGKEIMPEVIESFEAGGPSAGQIYELFAVMGPQAEAAMPLLESRLSDKEHVWVAMMTIKRMKPGAIDELSAELRQKAAENLYEGTVDPQADIMAFHYAVHMATLGKPAAPSILKLLRHPDPKFRGLAARSLQSANFHDEKLEAELFKLAREDTADVRAWAGSVVTTFGDSPDEAKSALLAVAKRGAGWRVARALAQYGPTIIEDLVPLLTPANRPGRHTAIITFQVLGASAVPRLIELLADDDEAVATAAAEALDHIRPQAVPALGEVVSMGGEQAAGRAVGVLYRMGLAAKHALPTLLEVAGSDERSDTLRIAAARAALEIDPSNRASKAVLSTVPALIRVLESGRFQDQGWAAEVAREIGPPAREALPQLRERLSLPDTDADTDGLHRMHVAQEAAKAITAIEVPEVWETMP